MRRNSMLSILALTTLLATGLVWNGEVIAGQFKRLTGSNLLGVGGSISAHASPRNQGTAMEMDVYEYQSAAVAANYRCSITQNSTGRALRLRRIGVDGSITATCITAINGVCSLPLVAHAANLLFQCTVATASSQPVSATAHYTIAVQR